MPQGRGYVMLENKLDYESLWENSATEFSVVVTARVSASLGRTYKNCNKRFVKKCVFPSIYFVFFSLFLFICTFLYMYDCHIFCVKNCKNTSHG